MESVIIFTFSLLSLISIIAVISMYFSTLNFETWGNIYGENKITIEVNAYPDPEDSRNYTFTFPEVSLAS